MSQIAPAHHFLLFLRRPTWRVSLWCCLMLALATLGCNLQLGGLPTPVVPNAGSQVMFIAPAANSILAHGAVITFAVKVHDTGAGVTQVDFMVNDRVIGSQTTPDGTPLPSFTAVQQWQTDGLRGHLISALALRADGSMIGKAEMTVQVVAATFVPLTPQAASSPTVVTGVATTPPPPTALTRRAGIATNTPPPLPPGTYPILRVTTTTLNVRSGPGTDFNVIATLKQGDEAAILGRNDNRTWWFTERNRVKGWVTSDPSYSTVRGDVATVPFVQTPSTALPSLTPVRNQTLAPTSTVAAAADLVIDAISLTPPTPLVNDTFFLTITVRNQGTLDAPSSLARGLFQPGNEQSEIAVPPIPAGQVVTLPPMYVTLRQSGANQIGVMTLDVKGEISEGANGEANNVRTFSYDVSG